MAAIPNAVLTKTACSTKSRTVGALVMGGDYRGLALVRSLGRRGIPVCVIRQGDQRLAAISRYATRTLFYPRWGGNEGVDYLLEVGRKYALDQWLLFPTSDESVRLMATHHERLKEQYQLTVPPWDTLQWAVDKRLMNELADETGVDHPRTYYAPNRDAIRSFDLQFPVILKPAARDQFNRLTVQKAWRQVNVPQCGFCQAGQIMQAAALLMDNPKPSHDQIREAMSGNICRCGCYQRIENAVHLASTGV